MAVIFLKESLRPRYFISYSRKDQLLVSSIMASIENHANFVWQDIEQIAIGDDWLREIEGAIGQCDELILFVSESSIQSKVVAREIQVAQSLGKEVRPIKIGATGTAPPQYLSGLNFLDLSTPGMAVANLVCDYLKSDDNCSPFSQKVVSAHSIKKNSCRGIWPEFSEAALMHDGQRALATILPELEQALPNHSRGSLMLMNAGLINCILGAWDRGLHQLKAHAESAGNFSGWYFYALHVNENSAINSLSPGKGEEALRACLSL